METQNMEAPQRYAPGGLGALIGGLLALVICSGLTCLMAFGVWVFLSELGPTGWAWITVLLLGCVALGLIWKKSPALVERILEPIVYSWAIVVWGLFILGLLVIFLRSLFSMLKTYDGTALLLFATLIGVLSRGWGGRDGDA